ncbi:hypothetical protein FK256_01020 [Actinomyces johnsonii]|uniref:Uncharacterized protein n=1 Tax=Actinomyces johnsonii TaxID=544581 RepID=A0A508AFC0_9ACTO|nr:hypothetical protein [Actinomyces johnsonii]KAA8743162.1 hypothetical protein F4W10_04015 [Actinomyces johnsonii]TQD44512.1 hypothetical protein FK256_01020 [Actinomyces johnsonii]
MLSSCTVTGFSGSEAVGTVVRPRSVNSSAKRLSVHSPLAYAAKAQATSGPRTSSTTTMRASRPFFVVMTLR